jgi:hypothetical protein
MPNDLWCADFKGEFKHGDGRSCYPLTSPTRPRAFCSPAKPLNRRANRACSTPSSGSLPSAACRRRSAAIMACFRQSQRPLQSVEAVGLVAAARQWARAHQAGLPAGERTTGKMDRCRQKQTSQRGARNSARVQNHLRISEKRQCPVLATQNCRRRRRLLAPQAEVRASAVMSVPPNGHSHCKPGGNAWLESVLDRNEATRHQRQQPFLLPPRQGILVADCSEC